MSNIIPTPESTVIDAITAIIDALQFTCKPLVEFDPIDDEHCFNAAELAGMNQSLHGIREIAEQAYITYTQQLSADMPQSGELLLPSLPVIQQPSINPVIKATLQGTLSEIINVLQFLTLMLDSVEVVEDQRVFDSVEVLGLYTIITGIKTAAEYCFSQCSDQ